MITKVKTGFRKKIVLPLKVQTPQAGPPDRNAAMKKSMKKKKKAPKADLGDESSSKKKKKKGLSKLNPF